MDSSPLTISIGYDGPVCVLSAVGDLDTRTADRFQRCVLAVLAGLPERLVLDLAGLCYLDCGGASQRPHRAAQLSAVSQSASDLAARARCRASAPHHQQQLMCLPAAPRSSEAGPTIGTSFRPVVSRAALPSSDDTDVHDLLAVRAVIEQAKGVLMATYRCGPDEACDLLHKASQGLDVKVHVLAASVVELAAHGVSS